MLSELYIENLAVIQKATVPIENNLNIFTGETGAGKSILINGINAVLGQRVTKDIVRTGADKAIIIALFRNISSATKAKLADFGFDCDDDQLTISREISADGGSVARVNSRTCTVNVLKELGETLINIHGQHDNQILLAPERHINILDSFGGLESLLADYQSSFKILQDTARKIKNLTLDEIEKTKRIEFLTERVNEISALELEENEDISIEEEFQIAQNSDRIEKVLLFSTETLNGMDNEDNIIDRTEEMIQELSSYTDVMSDLKPLCDRLISAKIELTDIFEELSEMIGRLDLDPQRLAYLTERRDALNRIKRLYGPELSDVIRSYETAQNELNELEGSATEIEKLKEEKQKLLAEVSEKAKKLSTEREKAAKRFIAQVSEELKFLDMPNVKLEVAHEKGKLTVQGMDAIEFLISANIGEPPKPISKIASGGELSRIMLALKCVIADKDNIPTLIFDEIDTGVSGRAAQKIGIKLAQISKFRQVICVTHLAQLAIMADNHLLIEKKVADNRTVTQIQKLDFEGQKREIARIMGGDNATELMLKNAEELLKSKDKRLGTEYKYEI